jgi:Domain of unknown function (DUF6894)
MQKFFFHLSNGTTIPDTEGEPCHNAEYARAYAMRVARELAQGGGYQGHAIKVVDEQENEIACIPIDTA